jgi:hypothetical protein
LSDQELCPADEAEFKMANLNEDIETTLSFVRHELKDRIQYQAVFQIFPWYLVIPTA